MSDNLAKYATTELNSRGREHQVQLAKDRNPFQRDYTRILHSRTWRLTQGKTQVFPAEMGGISDTYRTRMSHSLEVEQISRSIARQLGLNQDLCASLSIGHDIGHAPFGHSGQDILNEAFSDIGGFEHNHQALRLVDLIESPYPDHLGLNLMFETREGLLKHCSRERALSLGPVAARHLDGTHPVLEVQVVDLSDSIAYLHGDLEDAIDKGIVTPSFLMNEMPGFKMFWEQAVSSFPDLQFPSDTDVKDPVKSRSARAALSEVWRRMLSDAIESAVSQSRYNLETHKIDNLFDVRLFGKPLISLSNEKAELHRNLRKFSRKYIYEHEIVEARRIEDRAALKALCSAAIENPLSFGLNKKALDDKRVILDWIASLTDRSVTDWYKLNSDINHSLKNKKTISP